MSERATFAGSLRRGRGIGIALAVIGLGAWAFALATSRDVALQSYLYAFMVWATLTLGCFGLQLLHNVTRATWSLPLLRLLEAGGGAPTLVLMGVLFAPIGLSLSSVYPWANPANVQADHVLQAKEPYLNPTFFLIRTAAYFVVWALIATALRRSSVRQDADGNSAEGDRRANISAPGLAVFALTVTFAATDWVMSLEPHWFSSIYGIWFMIQMALTALAFASFVVLVNVRKAPYCDVADAKLTKDAGTLLFAFTMFWAYITLSQFLIIYAANLPEFTPYFVSRSSGGWNVVSWGVVVFGFFVPWLSLLAPRTSRTLGMLLSVVSLILVVRVVDMYWIVMPAMRKGGINVQWSDIAAVVGLGGAWFAVFATQALRAPLIPNHPGKVEEVLEHA